MPPTNTPSLFPLWLIFIFTQAAFCLAPWVVPMAGEPPAESAVLASVLPLIAIFDYAASFLLPRLLLKRAAALLPRGIGVTAPSDAEVLKIAAPALVIQYALLEFVTLLGLVHSLVAHNPRAGLPYAALGILGTVLARPNPERLRRYLRDEASV